MLNDALDSKYTSTHEQLGHPGFSRLYHFVRSRNLLYTSDKTKNAINNYRTRAEVKPSFFKPAPGSLIKATRPWERLSIDFKGPARGPKPYLFVAIDEYSRFPFVFACSSTTTKTVVECLNNLFCLFGFPAYAHSDRGSSFMSSDLKVYFAERGIASRRSTPYHPTGNSQCERTNHTVWKTIKLLLHHRG